MQDQDFKLTAGWGHFGTNDIVMSGQGRTETRSYTKIERTEIDKHFSVLGNETFDVYLNENAFWRNIPSAVWNYKLGGYPVLKKWLSYRTFSVLGRPMKSEEVQYFSNIARRIAAILLLYK